MCADVRPAFVNRVPLSSMLINPSRAIRLSVFVTVGGVTPKSFSQMDADYWLIIPFKDMFKDK